MFIISFVLSVRSSRCYSKNFGPLTDIVGCFGGFRLQKSNSWSSNKQTAFTHSAWNLFSWNFTGRKRCNFNSLSCFSFIAVCNRGLNCSACHCHIGKQRHFIYSKWIILFKPIKCDGIIFHTTANVTLMCCDIVVYKSLIDSWYTCCYLHPLWDISFQSTLSLNYHLMPRVNGGFSFRPGLSASLSCVNHLIALSFFI